MFVWEQDMFEEAQLFPSRWGPELPGNNFCFSSPSSSLFLPFHWCEPRSLISQLATRLVWWFRVWTLNEVSDISRCRYWLRFVLPALASNSGIAVRSHLLLALGLAGGERLFVMVTHSSSLSLWFYSLIYTLEVPVCPCGLQRRLINYGCNKDEFLET